jgi:hypothetical protein
MPANRLLSQCRMAQGRWAASGGMFRPPLTVGASRSPTVGGGLMLVRQPCRSRFPFAFLANATRDISRAPCRFTSITVLFSVTKRLASDDVSTGTDARLSRAGPQKRTKSPLAWWWRRDEDAARSAWVWRASAQRFPPAALLMQDPFSPPITPKRRSLRP